MIKLRKRVRNGAIIHLMVHDPNGHNNCDWARSKWGTHPSLPLKGRSLSISAVLGCVRRCVSRELGRQDLNIMPCLPCSCLCPWGIESRTHWWIWSQQMAHVPLNHITIYHQCQLFSVYMFKYKYFCLDALKWKDIYLWCQICSGVEITEVKCLSFSVCLILLFLWGFPWRIGVILCFILFALKFWYYWMYRV